MCSIFRSGFGVCASAECVRWCDPAGCVQVCQAIVCKFRIYLLIANIQSQRLRDYVLSHRTLRVLPVPQHVDGIDAEQL